jgi:hypothetical protein
VNFRPEEASSTGKSFLARENGLPLLQRLQQAIDPLFHMEVFPLLLYTFYT